MSIGNLGAPSATATLGDRLVRLAGSPGLWIAAFVLAAVAALTLKLRLPLGPNAWDTAVYLDAVQRIRMGQVPSLDFFAPVGPLGYYGAALLDWLFPLAQPMLLVNWALLPVLLPLAAILAASVSARSRPLALALILPLLLFAALPINLHGLYPMPGFDGYGNYNRHVALLLYALIATLLFMPRGRLATGLVAALMLTLFLVKITGAVTGALLVGYAILAGRLRLRDAVLAAGAEAGGRRLYPQARGAARPEQAAGGRHRLHRGEDGAAFDGMAGALPHRRARPAGDRRFLPDERRNRLSAQGLRAGHRGL